MKAFLQAVATNTPTPVSGEDGIQDLLVGLAAGKSLKEGRPVKVSEIKLG
jgi:myo-inositol 2-dehydrogenase/D-chiro-inositol 1-dehydrogenase